MKRIGMCVVTAAFLGSMGYGLSMRAGETIATYRNPVIPGFHPDPSICRVGEDYYLVTSSFEYFPGVPLFHSRDLVHWRQIGHCLTRPSQLPLERAGSSGGIYAPTLRHHNGVFYMITTNVSSRGNFYVTARDAAGEWSEPVWLDDGSIDPSLLFDDDGKAYFTRQGEGERGGIYQSEIDLERGRLLQRPRKIWSGTGGVWPEGPHLYKISGRYYLMIAEGGTSYDHMETIARAESPWGPFEPCPRNPILTHRDKPDHPIQATGHADLVQARDGHWWMVFLGIRPQGGRCHHLGRETFLAPVAWDREGWPVVHGGQPIELSMTAPGIPPQPWDPPATRDDFTGRRFAFSWNFLRNPRETSYSQTARPGWLRLLGSRVSLDDVDSPTFVGRRQEHLRCHASTLMDFEPTEAGQEAGLVVRANENYHYDLLVKNKDGQRHVLLRIRVNGVSRVAAVRALPKGPVVLTAQARELEYEFFFSVKGGAPERLGAASTKDLSSEIAGGFTGAYFGLYAARTGAGDMPPADFDWFEYGSESWAAS